jgi:hypothetical protein
MKVGPVQVQRFGRVEMRRRDVENAGGGQTGPGGFKVAKASKESPDPTLRHVVKTSEQQLGPKKRTSEEKTSV